MSLVQAWKRYQYNTLNDGLLMMGCSLILEYKPREIFVRCLHSISKSANWPILKTIISTIYDRQVTISGLKLVN